MKVKVIKKNVFLYGRLWKIGSTISLEDEKDFNQFMEWIEEPKPKTKPKAKAKAKAKTSEASE